MGIRSSVLHVKIQRDTEPRISCPVVPFVAIEFNPILVAARHLIQTDLTPKAWFHVAKLRKPLSRIV